MSSVKETIDWYLHSYSAGEFLERYKHLEVVAGVEDLDASYSFSYVGVFYDPKADAYLVGTTSGCSCPSPWEDDTSEMSEYLSKSEVVSKFRRALDSQYGRWGAGHVLDAVNAINAHRV